MSVFTNAYQSLATARQADPAWLKAWRADAFDRFAAAGLPTRRNEEWKYTSLRAIGDHDFGLTAESGVCEPSTLAFLSPDDLVLVFVDGVLSTEHSRLANLPAGVTLASLRDALKQRPDDVKGMLTASAALPDQPFGTLSDAFVQDGTYLKIARNVKVAATVQIVHVTTNAPATPTAFFPRHFLALEEGAEARVVETYVGTTDAAYFVAQATDITLAANAQLDHVRIQSEGSAAVHISRGRATLAKDARLRSFNFAAGSKLCRTDFDVALIGAGAEVHLDGLYLAQGEQHLDNHTTIDHRVPNATSSQLYKGILDDKGRAVFNGKVLVRQDAQGTNAFQMNRNLLLSSEAEIDTKPELQIDADDVKCSHGASIGQLDQGQIFYLQSRGIKRDEAIGLLSEAFAFEALLKVTDPITRRRLAELAKEVMS